MTLPQCSKQSESTSLLWVLLAIGLLSVFSASYPLTPSYGYIVRQLFFAFTGLGIYAGSYFFAKKYPLARISYPFLICVVLLLLPQTPLGWSVNGAMRWIRLGSFSFQPSELAKVFWMFYVVDFVLKAHFEVQKDLFASRWLWARLLTLIVLLIIQPDFGTAFLLTALTLSVLFVARVRLDFYFYMIFLAFLGLGVIMLGAPYRWRRLIAYWDPWQFAQDQSYQLIQSLIAVGSGGIFGQGWGQSWQKHGALPEAHTDFIFSIWAEETGFIGVAFFIFILYCFLSQLIVRVRELATREDYHECYFTLAVALLIFIQSVLNMGVCLGLLPTKGLTLPLMSYGGSSLWIILFMIGLADGCWKRCTQQ